MAMGLLQQFLGNAADYSALANLLVKDNKIALAHIPQNGAENDAMHGILNNVSDLYENMAAENGWYQAQIFDIYAYIAGKSNSN